MQEMASEFEELHGQYPFLSQLSAIALTVPVSSVNCERDFSAMNRVKPRLSCCFSLIVIVQLFLITRIILQIDQDRLEEQTAGSQPLCLSADQHQRTSSGRDELCESAGDLL